MKNSFQCQFIKNKFHQLINKVEIDYNNFDCKELIITLEHNYKKVNF